MHHTKASHKTTIKLLHTYTFISKTVHAYILIDASHTHTLTHKTHHAMNEKPFVQKYQQHLSEIHRSHLICVFAAGFNHFVLKEYDGFLKDKRRNHTESYCISLCAGILMLGFG